MKKRKILNGSLTGRCCLLLLFLLSVAFVRAQSFREVSGAITDDKGEPIIGVSVTVEGISSAGTISDIDGRYSLQLPQKKVTLVFSFIGYKTVVKTLDANARILNVEMEEDNKMLDEVVVVGYGTMKKKDLTGSVSHIGEEVMQSRVATNALDFLSASIAGVNLTPSTDAAGGGSLLIRGKQSLKASSSPLIVLDGVIFYGNIDDINPNDIESMDVLKDASSTAIYGAKGSAGVIMINTKRGKSSKPVINISAKVGTVQATFTPVMPTPEQFIQRRMDYWKTQDYFKPSDSQMKNGYYDNPYNLPEGVTQEQWAGYDASFSGDYIGTWLTRLGFDPLEIENYKAGRVTDWMDLVLQNGFRQDYNASVSGKNERTNYYFSLGYTNNDGFKVGDYFQAVRARINLDTQITKWLNVGLNAQFATKDQSGIGADISGAKSMSPFGNMWEEDGTIKVRPANDNRTSNPLLAHTVDSKLNKRQTLVSSVYGKLKLPWGFSWQTTFNARFGWIKDYYFDSDIKPGVDAGGKAKRRDFSDYEWSVDNMLKWNQTFGGIHNFDFTFVYTVEKYQSWDSTGENKAFQPNGNLIFHAIQSGIAPTVTSTDEMQTGNGLLWRLNYSLLDRYLLTAAVRRDGFSAFGQNDPYGVFPSAAVAWRMNEEKFLKNVDWLDNLKLRFSWGQTGNRDIGRYAAFSRLTVTNAIMNGVNYKAVYPSSLANRNLKWETTTGRNIGLDFGVLNNRITGTVDAYWNKTTDLLMDRAMPEISGYGSIASNLGQIDNKGVEVTVTTTNINVPGKVHWTTSFIYSTNKNEIKHLYGNMIDVLDADGNVVGQREDDDVQNGWYIGHGIDDIYDYKFVGIWQMGEELEADKYGKQPGDPKLEDVNNDGVINEDDKQWLGSKIPTHRLNISSSLDLWNCVNFSFTLRGEFGWKAVDNLARNEDNRYFNQANSVWTEYWTPWNPSAGYARLGSDCNNPTVNIYKNRSYMKMQNMSLSYTFPKHLIQKLQIENLRVSLNVDNAFTISGWRTSDPMVNAISPRIFTFGVNMTL
ncbi:MULTISPECIES: SusC/RagA family TonB-linked outer membrane protein [Bacteroides]|uniref:TonB-dependent receptor n=1 Tax=Bacteroides gallinaceum TaxID=1462571 RepID=A0ABT7VDB6_9BACE|nr:MULTISPECIES: TonB-dependent receptor [Bacteroides]MCR8917655.1 TonB-dependent receptor [Bacteroides sp. ET225]MDM8324257.1 TonB-dependent receptor [Bacteroides gallinaceum]